VRSRDLLTMIGVALAASAGMSVLLRRRMEPSPAPDVDQEAAWLAEAVDLGARIEREKQRRGESGPSAPALS